MTSGKGSTRAVGCHTDLRTMKTAENVFNGKYKGKIWELLRNGVHSSEPKLNIVF